MSSRESIGHIKVFPGTYLTVCLTHIFVGEVTFSVAQARLDGEVS